MTDNNNNVDGYIQPDAKVIPILSEQVICGSPLPGGNEGIGFEDWN